MKFGYARVSTGDQKALSQIDALKAAGVEEANIFTDKISGKLASRPAWDDLRSRLREGDTLYVTRLSRMGRSLANILTTVAEFRERGVDLVVLKQDLDTTTPAGRLLFHIMAAIDEFQRELISENTLEGLAAARARGRNGGRPEKLSEKQWSRILADVERGAQGDKTAPTIKELAEEFHVSRQTIYNMKARRDQAAADAQAEASGGA
jgi:DNA invertase Pin-like site-specific DNA recombinase